MLIWIGRNEATGEVINGWLKQYDPEANGGQGFFEVTDSRDEALVFETVEEVHACWTQVPKALPKRPDGKPNRPLTALTIEARPAEGANGVRWGSTRRRGGAG